MEFVQGLPKGIYVGQTRIEHPQTIATSNQNLSGFNLALHVNDDAERVQQHRMLVLNELSAFGVDKITWMTQTHSTICHTINEEIPFQALEGDGVVTQRKAHALMMMTADCLPLLLCDAAGTQVAAVHAGWRGLCDGVIEATLAHFARPDEVLVYLGPAISQSAFEVGPEVRAAFISHSAQSEQAFVSGNGNKWQADLYLLAKQRLQACGVQHIYGGQYCTYQQSELFFSYRRDGQTGRMASSIWLA